MSCAGPKGCAVTIWIYRGEEMEIELVDQSLNGGIGTVLAEKTVCKILYHLFVY